MITIYDIKLDTNRLITQEEVDELVRVKQAYGHLLMVLSEGINKANSITTNSNIEHDNFDSFSSQMKDDWFAIGSNEYNAEGEWELSCLLHKNGFFDGIPKS